MADIKNRLVKTLQAYYQKMHYDRKLRWDGIALKFMEDCERILDIGCGIGRFISHNPHKIIGVDRNLETLKICRQKGYNVEYAEVTNLPFEDFSFDGVHCSHVIEHLLPTDAYKLLKEVDRVLKVGGILCLRTPLLHSGFYYDLTHIKPYYPQAILHYLENPKRNQGTMEDIPGLYKTIKLKYRRSRLFPGIYNTPFWFLSPLCNVLSRFGITSLKKDAYILILRKVK